MLLSSKIKAMRNKNDKRCPRCGGEHDPDQREKAAKERGVKALKNARKKFDGTVNNVDHLFQHGMDASRINDVVSNPAAVFYDMNKGFLKFFQNGDLVVTDKRDMSKGKTAFGQSDNEGIAVKEKTLTTGKYQCRVYQIE